MARIAEQLGAPRTELPEKIAGLLDRLKAADRENARLRQQTVHARAGELAGTAVDANGVQVVTTTTHGSTDDARTLATAVLARLPAAPGTVAVALPAGTVVIAVNQAARDAGLRASDLVKRLLNGRGGGSAQLAQGGGLTPDRVTSALGKLPGLIATR